VSENQQRRTATTEQLRRDIDSGRTGEKVAYPDPATVPLGGDDEAAGHPPPREELQALREREARKAPPDRPKNARPGREQDGGLSLIPLAIVTAVIAIVLILFAVFGFL